ncbi:MAG: HAMP domain-containing histidine kinase [Alphaproteobacteria bacterium]|nr:HAMP domain-containing histidine kinase [Alphaproteobacteria bacterium]
MTARHSSLLHVVFRRIAAFGALAMVIQFSVVAHEYWTDETKLVRKIITLETELLAAGIRPGTAEPAFEVPAGLRSRYRPANSLAELETNGYFVLINDADGHRVFTNCDRPACMRVLNHDTSHMPDFWFHMLAPNKPLSFIGGRRLPIAGETYQFNIGSFQDPENRIIWALWEEILSHMLVPMSIMLVLVVGATTLSVRTALRPVLRASAIAAQADPNTTALRLDTAGMPREIARFSEVINRNFGRINDLIKGQKLFASAISHEIRTPVSIVRLELEQIDHPRARKAIDDLDGLTHLLNQLTALAKLDAVDPASFVDVDLVALVENVISDMVPLVYARSKSIEFENHGGSPVWGVPNLLENLVRNLVENSVKHTPAGTHIVVSTGPGAQVSVRDNGPGIVGAPSQAGMVTGQVKLGDGLGIGLNIITGIAKLHRAVFSLGSEPGEGTRATIRFPT